MRHQVRLTARAEADLDSVLRWFQQQSALQAWIRWSSEFQKRLSALEKQPARFAIAIESASLGVELRELHFGKKRGKYRVIFQMEGKTVYVLRIWHCARNAISLHDLE